MASTTFTFSKDTNAGAQTQESSAVSVGAAESVRVRFSTPITGLMTAFLSITANSTTNLVPIDDPDAWATGAVAEGDSVKVVVKLNGSLLSACAGILETFA